MISKVDIIKEKILNDISSGRLRPGSALPSRHQFMRRFGCARGSIDAAVTELTQGGFLYSRQGAGTYVADKNKSEGINQVFIIGDFQSRLPLNVNNQSVSSLAAEIQGHVNCYVYHRHDVNINLNKITVPGSAVIWIRPDYSELMIMEYLRNCNIPQLLIGRNFADFDNIRTDARAGIREGLEWLTANAGNEVFFITSENKPDLPFLAERQLAFYELAVELGIKLRPESIIKVAIDRSGSEISSVMDRLMSLKSFPKAIFASVLAPAASMITLTDAKGYRLGKDYHILMFDDIPEYNNVPGIGMLKQRWDEMEKKVVEWIFEKKNKSKNKKFEITIKPEFIRAQ